MIRQFQVESDLYRGRLFDENVETCRRSAHNECSTFLLVLHTYVRYVIGYFSKEKQIEVRSSSRRIIKKNKPRIVIVIK